MYSNEYLLKICAIGSGSVEKTPLIRRFAENKFDTNYLPTLGVDITTKKITLNGIGVKLIIVDTAGQEFFGKLRPSYYRGASACIIFFDRNNRKSFLEIPNHIIEFQKYILPEVPLALVGITSSSPVVSHEEALMVAKSFNGKYFECRSKSCPEIAHVFSSLARNVIYPSTHPAKEILKSIALFFSLYRAYLTSYFLRLISHLFNIIPTCKSSKKSDD